VSSNHDMVSGEGVAYDLLRADVGSRTVAALIDLVIQAIALIILIVFDVNFAGAADEAAISATVLSEFVAVFAIYPIVIEWLTKGRSVGKLAMGLRVLRDDGGPIGFRQALVRGLAGLILEKPGLAAPLTTAIGLLTMTFSSRAKRVGDMMAGTFVVNERGGTRRNVASPTWYVAAPLQSWAAVVDLSRVDDGLALSIRQFLTRATQMRPEAQHSLGEQLRAQVQSRISPQPPDGAPTPWFLMAILAERRRRADLATHAGPHTVAQPTQPSAPMSAPQYESPTPNATGGFVPPT